MNTNYYIYFLIMVLHNYLNIIIHILNSIYIYCYLFHYNLLYIIILFHLDDINKYHYKQNRNTYNHLKHDINKLNHKYYYILVMHILLNINQHKYHLINMFHFNIYFNIHNQLISYEYYIIKHNVFLLHIYMYLHSNNYLHNNLFHFQVNQQYINKDVYINSYNIYINHLNNISK